MSLDSPASLEWTKHKPKFKNDSDINNPGKRSGHSLNIIGANAFMFGGLAMDDNMSVNGTNDVFVLRLNTSQLEWHKVSVKGIQPLPRWKHTATVIDNTSILVIGGYFSSSQRLNDVWVYDVMGSCWRQPHETHNAEAIIPNQLSNNHWNNCISPRASHTTTLIGDLAYVFGGYGGFGYSRRDLDDLFTLDIKSWTWSKVQAKGMAPEKRSGHQACGVDSKLYIFGGWNSSTQFQDLHILDTAADPPLWSKAQSTLPCPTWNHTSCAVMAIPTWKIFTFGGSSGPLSEGDRLGQLWDGTSILETGTSRWSQAPIEGQKPSPRADTCMAYDAKNSRLIVYGGWSNEWHEDVFSLDVGNVVGPPYAVTDMVPNMGPVTGGTEAIIHGIDFINTTDVVVRFGTKRHFLDVTGVYISQTRISCVSPDYSKFPPGEVEVRVALEGDSFTTTFQKFSYFSVTNAAKSIMFGPGLLSGCAIKDEVTFLIQARDDNGVNRTTGGDEFTAIITLLGGGEDGEDLRIQGVTVEDLGSGRYEVAYTAQYAGSYEIRVDFNGTFGGTAGPVRGSGVVVKFDEMAPRDNNTMGGDLMMAALRADVERLVVFTKELIDGIFVRVKDDTWSPEEQIRALVRVKEYLMRMEDEAEEISLLVDRCDAVMQYLREMEVNLDGFEERLAIGKAHWDRLQREAPQVQTRIAPLMRAHAAKIRADIYSYEQHVTAYKQSLADVDFKLYATGADRSLSIIGKCDDVFIAEKQNCQKMLHIANIFETYKDMIASQDMMNEIEDMLHDFRLLWECAVKVTNVIDDWKQCAWADLDAEAFDESAKALVAAIRRLPKTVKTSDAFRGLDRVGKEFLNTCPLITSLRSPAMRERHWHELMDVVKKEFTLPQDNPHMLLKDLLELDLFNVTAEVEEITDKAAKESRHEETLRQLQVMWSGIEFSMNYYKDTEIPLLRLEDENIEQLESDQMAVQSIVGSRYSFFKDKAVEWQKALSAVSEVTQILAELQRTWSYLEPLFIGSEEVRRELPEDAKRFQEIDSQVRSILVKSWKIRNVKAVCEQPNLLESLVTLEKKQESCRKALSEFLDGKRRQFPRFYFMSEADLLDLLSSSSQPARVLQHVDKILLATKELLLTSAVGTDRPQATTFVAGVGKEVVSFAPPVLLSGKAELYLDALLQAQRYTLAKALQAAVNRYPTLRRTEWLMSKSPKGETVDPAQISLLTAHIEFVKQIEKVFGLIQAGDKRAMDRYLEVMKVQLSDLITLTQTGLGKGDRQRVMCMITMDAHNRDIVETLLREKVLVPTDFQWQSKLRPKYLPDTRGVNATASASFDICDASFEYGFEYLGNGPRLVVTPLTDRIYVTATQALTLKMGCAPAGPAGTGKTETTKDLASALGKCCYVFNCSPEMDYQSMGNIFKGLASSGSWGCFDEFNRLIPEVLSVASVQFKAVCDSLKTYNKYDNTSHFVTIEGDKVGLDPSCGTFITMNPGYLGRSELPEGLKALFRPITVVVPDLVLICENMLMAEGFLAAKVLASKFYGLYSLLDQLLSHQAHYDWGLRAVKSVLVVAGQLKRAEPELDEEALLMRALRDFNIPKIVQADQVVFFGLLNDLFPGLSPPRVVDEDLSECITIACEEANLWPDDQFTLKVMQLDELLDIRHCVFIMGPAGAGKSSCWKVLQGAKNIKYPDSKVKTVDINPKVMPTEDLYGHISMSTREWKDGLLSSLLRDLGRVANDHPKWMILDGDLDSLWIESMNSLMDDNKMLTLASNERIPLKASMRMIFEIRDLNYATPATVSRAGILYISTESGSQWRSIIGSWVQGRPEEIFDDTDRERIHGYFERYLPECLKYFASTLQSVVPCNDISITISILKLLDVVLTRSIVQEENTFETAFVFCLVWGFGSVLTVSDDGTDYRKLFSDWFRIKNKSLKIPNRDTIFDYWLDPHTNKFDSWKQSPAFRTVDFDSSYMNMADITVPTAETASVSYWLTQLVLDSRNVMLAGPAGTGKTQIVNGMLSQLNSDNHMYITVNMNYYTSASVLQSNLEAPLHKRTGSSFGPPGSARLVYFVDDLNLPEVDPYNTQSAIALLRQHIDYGHWYDLQKLMLKSVDDCNYVTAMNPTAGSFHVDPRLQRHFTTFAVGMPSVTSLLTIYQTFLDGHLMSGGFSSSVSSLSAALIKGALAVHKEVSETFRKTATNFHYEFNIRHITNVFQGLLVATREAFNDGEKFVHLWLHESERVYGDRLVDAEDLNKLKHIMHSQARKAFFQFNVSRFYLSGGGIKADPLIFCHFADGATQGEIVYDQGTDLDYLRATLETSLQDYNETSTVMNLVLFDDAVLHCARIVRIIKQTGGHALLIGVGGSGKQSLSRLAAHICGYSTFQIMVNQAYGLLDFKADLQSMFNKAGIKQEGVLFLLADSQVSNERFFVYINDLLSSGNIPDLYSRDERETIISSLTPKAKAAGYSVDPISVWKYFISKVRENLHCSLCFSPVGGTLRTRARRFPALVNCTVIDWFQPWPEQALISVSKKLLSTMDLGANEVRLAIEHYMPAAFVMVTNACKTFASSEGKYVYTTPKTFLEMIHYYGILLEKKRNETNASIFRLQNGIEKLEQAAADVVLLESNLKVMLLSAEEKKRVAEGIAETVRREREIVEMENAKAKVEESNVADIQAEVAAKHADAAADLAQAEPALMRAMAALDSLDRKDLGNCKTMVTPPAGVEDVFSAVMVLLAGVNPNIIVQKSGRVRDKDRKWDASKKALLGNVNGFLDELKNFKINIDENTVPEINWKEVRPFLLLEHFSPEVIEKRNSAAAGLCAWVINIVTYYDIVQLVEPKRVALKAANEQLDTANAQLTAVRARVAELQARLDALTEEYATAEASRLEAQRVAERGRLKLNLANRLIKALGSEKVRWHEGMEVLDSERSKLVGDCLLAASFVSYVGPFTKAYREKLMESLTPLISDPPVGASIATTDFVDALGVLCTEAEIAEYQTQGLPADRVSAENAAIVLNSSRYPLLIDPQLQAIFWIKRRMELIVTRLGQSDFYRKLMDAMQTGTPFLVENMGEKIPADLIPVIARSTIRRGNKKFAQFGDQEVEVLPTFRLYLHTKLNNPHYPPEIQAETAVVNFSVTQQGLEEQLLALVVRHERSDLASQRAALILQQNLFTIRMQQLEDNILRRLAEAQGDITEDQALIEELELSKKLSNDIAEKLHESRVNSERLLESSEKYRPVARRGALLFFVIESLHKIHTYYMFSLNSFVMFFMRGIQGADKDSQDDATSDMRGEDILREAQSGGGAVRGTGEADLQLLEDQIAQRVKEIEDHDKLELDADLPERLELLKQSVSLVVFDFVRIGLFEKDKLTVATLITLRILVDEGYLRKAYVDALLRGRAALDGPNRGDELSRWLSESSWLRLKALETDLGLIESVFADISEKVLSDCDDWEEWYNHHAPETHPMPGEFKELKEFQRLLLLRIFRPDRLPVALTTFVRENLGESFVTQQPFNMKATFRHTSSVTPILFVLYPGVDPTSWVEDLGRETGITAANMSFANISMGQGQEARADETIAKFAQFGGWVFLQNVHLMQAWLPTLEEKLETLNPHENFRVFISAEPPPLSYVKNIPEGLLQSCICVANEPPSDLKANLARAWASFNVNRVNRCAKPTEFKACLFGLSFFHSVMVGRRRFGFQGWSSAYGFNMGDLKICADILESYLNRNTPMIPWQDLRYLFGEIMYGGHITDFFDRRTNNEYLNQIFNERLLHQGELAPRLVCPNPAQWEWDHYAQFIERSLPHESPLIYGLHPNAEIGFLTGNAERLLSTILHLELGVSSSDGNAGASSTHVVSIARDVMTDLLRRCPQMFDLLDISERAAAKMTEWDGPYAVVVMQECTRLNELIREIRSSLEELQKGLNGQLNMSQAMEDMAECLCLNQVPGRNPFHTCNWERLAWASRKNLSAWFADLLQRRAQLSEWTETLALPYSIWLPGLINPTALLTAIKQVTARKNKLPLDNMSLETHVTRMQSPEEAEAAGVYAEDGIFVHGLLMEGARWADSDDVSTDRGYVVGGVACAGRLVESRLKQLITQMPVMYVRAISVQPEWSPESVGYLRGDASLYECPVYLTSARGNTFVFLSTLKTMDPVHHWILAGVALLMQSDD